ncbi:unannotated protein [freshwater metagenome]|uniref:Unannotated protein n=1 Tax=freshwater metagenome TaxID=449393 RepID=A0A6J7E213_9ZZZZ
MSDHSSGASRGWLGAPAAVLAAVAPTLRRRRGDVVVTMAVLIAGVTLSTAVPKFVKALLHHHPTAPTIVGFLVVLALDPFVNYAGHLRAAHLALRVGFEFRCQAFADVMASSPAAVDSSTRTTAIANVVTDVDRVEHGVEALVAWLAPGALRVVIALAFLSNFSATAALLMAAAIPLFLTVEARLSGRLVAADASRQEVADGVAATVDESLVALPSGRGLGLLPWFGRRLTVGAHHLDEVSLERHRLESQLHLGTRIVALLGLAGVTALGAWQHDGVTDLVPALLYVELAIVGLESLPAALRALQQAEASIGRLGGTFAESVLDASVTRHDDVAECDPDTTTNGARLQLVDPTGTLIDVPSGAWVVVVDHAGEESASWLTGAVPPALGQAFIDGQDASRLPGRPLVSVGSGARCVDASILDHLGALDANIDEPAALALLERLGVGHLAELADGGLHRPIGVNGQMLSIGEQQRVLLTMSLLANPKVIVTGELRPLADPLIARSVIDELRGDGRTVLTSVSSPELAEASDLVLYLTAGSWHLGTHHELLATVPSYVEHRHRADAGEFGELGALSGVGPLEREAIRRRMVTERYEAGDTIYRHGTPADRVVFVVAGRVEIIDAEGRRMALVGPGGACGDLRLTPGERRSETARAAEAVVVRTVGRRAWEQGLAGVLDADATERRILLSVLRQGSLPIEAAVRLVGDNDAARGLIANLLASGALRQGENGDLTAGSSARRTASTGIARDALDRLGGE